MEAQLSRHMKAAVATYGHNRIELEWRLGHRHHHFRPGVGADAWHRLQAALDASPAFQRSVRETVERMGDMGGIKCICDPVTQQEAWMAKKRLHDVDADPQGSPWSVRASISLEETGQAPDAAVTFKYERRKRRWSYRHRCWSIDLTQVSSNLPSELDEDRETYEVEIELVDQGILFERPVPWVVTWGGQMVADICSMMMDSTPVHDV